jgi:hypothetical protein
MGLRLNIRHFLLNYQSAKHFNGDQFGEIKISKMSNVKIRPHTFKINQIGVQKRLLSVKIGKISESTVHEVHFDWCG